MSFHSRVTPYLFRDFFILLYYFSSSKNKYSQYIPQIIIIILFNWLRNRGIHPLWVDGLDCSLVATPIPSVSCAPLTQKTAPLDEMISATSAVFLFYSVMLGFRVLISCEYTFNHNPCDELYGFHGLFTSCDPNFFLCSNLSIFSTIRPTATPVPKTARINPANVM